MHFSCWRGDGVAGAANAACARNGARYAARGLRSLAFISKKHTFMTPFFVAKAS